MSELPRISEVRRQVLTADERLLDFSPVRCMRAAGESDPIYLLLTDARLLVVRPETFRDHPETAVASIPVGQVSVLMLSADTLRLLLPDGPMNCRFPAPAVATAFRRGLQG